LKEALHFVSSALSQDEVLLLLPSLCGVPYRVRGGSRAASDCGMTSAWDLPKMMRHQRRTTQGPVSHEGDKLQARACCQDRAAGKQGLPGAAVPNI
jgi:hypothetical protein